MKPPEVPTTKIKVEEGVWVLVLGELSVFTLLFATFLYYRAYSPELYEVSRASLHQGLGALNTIVLLSSSYFVAAETRSMGAAGKFESARKQLLCGIACGLLFVVIKVVEYSSVISEGATLASNEFFMFYFVLTGIHLMHLVVGLALLSGIALQMRNQLAGNGHLSESLTGFSVSFWHMLDIVWIVLFPLLYLLR